ncbi:LysR substrate-binding domain-containing protein [Mesorhizobium sp. WSM3860]|uniref:LysR substrate-binding domain-containing protein n=1 Tax=Mesorhizobium sp. WSM3860 TaxID=2029403 RepID=UPI000BB03B9D|nr:LysR substrate-binding domain-containing protein [Mesorhizobium sp. WSM3860]PBC01403.1 LysR family transcriptional regulator [Mesorhizobium sp. WSM3860]
MYKPEMRELTAFVEVARQLNFTRAAANVGVSVPTFSQTLRGLEEKLGVRLLTRTTRSVSLTDAGRDFLASLEPLLARLDVALDGLNRFRSETGGRLRILGSRTASTLFVGPLIGRFLSAHPDIELEMLVDDLHLDLVESRIDAGIQTGERIEKDMVAVRLVDPFEEVLMASPEYLQKQGEPDTPDSLGQHWCVRLRSSWNGTVRPWVLTKGDQKIEPSKPARFVANDLRVLASVVRGGGGIGLLPKVLVKDALASRELVQVLDGWSSWVSGIYLFYPSRRQMPAALGAFIKFMRENKPGPGWLSAM